MIRILLYFISFFKFHYSKHTSLEAAFFTNTNNQQPGNVIETSLNYFINIFFPLEDVPARTRKHIASPQKIQAAKG